MKIAKKTVVEVVSEASSKMQDPNYSAVLVGGFVQTQQPTAQYLSAHEGDFGGAEEVVNAIFHTALIAQCYQRTEGREVPQISYGDLDQVADGDTEHNLEQRQPYVREYLQSNVENAAMRKALTLIALAMDAVY